jgi:hypothetical protein
MFAENFIFSKNLKFMFKIGCLISIIFLQNACAQSKINVALNRELDSILVEDQRYRALVSENFQEKKDSLAKAYHTTSDKILESLNEKMYLTDKSNLARIEQIIAQYGYPGKSLVGEPANEAAFYVIQHSPVIDKYLPLLKEAAEKKELKFTLYAMMLDRSLMYAGKPQLYGTQGHGFQTKNGGWQMIIWPIQNPKQINELRKKTGFKSSMEVYAKSLNIDYKVLTIAEVNKMKGL